MVASQGRMDWKMFKIFEFLVVSVDRETYSSYLDKMRQAYDEYVAHSRLDLGEVQDRAEKKMQEIKGGKRTALLNRKLLYSNTSSI